MFLIKYSGLTIQTLIIITPNIFTFVGVIVASKSWSTAPSLVERILVLTREKVKWLREKLTPLRVAVLLVVIVGLYAGWSFFEHSPSANVFCATCHTMEPFYKEFQQSPHKQFNCHACHELNLQSIAGTLGAFYLTVAGQAPDPEELRLEARLQLRGECLKCHSMKDLENFTLHRIHLGVVEISDTCSACHSTHLLKPQNSDCTRCHNYGETLEKHKGYHRYAFAITILEEKNLTKTMPPEILDIIQELAGPQVECYRCHGETAKWNIPLNEECYVGALKGKTCLDCHKDLPEIDITDNKCIDCHRK